MKCCLDLTLLIYFIHVVIKIQYVYIFLTREKNKKSAEQAAALVATISLGLISRSQLQTAVTKACTVASSCVELSEKNKVEVSSEVKCTGTIENSPSVSITNLSISHNNKVPVS